MSPSAVANVQTATKDAWVGARVQAACVAASDGCGLSGWLPRWLWLAAASLADHDSAPGAAHDCESLRKSCLRCLPASHSAAERLKWLVLLGGARAPRG